MAASNPPSDQESPSSERDWLSNFTRDEATPITLGKKYTFFVRFLRYALPAAAMVIVGVLIAGLTGKDPYQPVAAVETPTPTVAEAVMLDANYEGVDAENRPYSITADKVSRSLETPDIMNLVKPMADITLKDGTWLAAQATQGRYGQEAGSLFLQGLVRLFHDAGYELRTEEIDIDLTNSRAKSQTPVQGQGPQGVINARGMMIERGGEHIVFLGPVKLILHALGKDGKEQDNE